MALRFSTGLRDFVQNFGSMKQALQNGVIRYYTGAQPTSPDDPIVGTLLVELTLAAGARTAEVRSVGNVTLTSYTGAGSISVLTVDSVSLITNAVTISSDLAATALLLVAEINRTLSSPDYVASIDPGNSAKVLITAMPGTGTGPNSKTVAVTATGLTATPGNMASGVAAVNGLPYDISAAGVLSKLSTAIWSGVAVATGTAGCFRLIGSVADANGSSTTQIRIDGNIGSSGSGANIEMANTAIVSGATSALTGFNLTEPMS